MGEHPAGRSAAPAGRPVTRSLLATLVLALAWGVLSAGVAFAGPDEGSFASAVNAARSGHGVAAMSLQADLSAVARAQAQRCADADELFHNPTLGADVSGWQVVAENVGVGGDWRSIEDAFMASPEHRANILDPVFTQFGIGTAVGKDGSLWVSQVFRAPSGAAPTVSGSGSGPAVGGSAPSSASTWTAPPPPSPEDVLRGKIAQARKAVRSGKRSDPLRSAVDFATVMSTVGR